MMDNGYARNFITVKKGRFNILVEDEPLHTSGSGAVRGRMETHLDFRSELCTPVGMLSAGSLSIYCALQHDQHTHLPAGDHGDPRYLR